MSDCTSCNIVHLLHYQRSTSALSFLSISRKHSISLVSITIYLVPLLALNLERLENLLGVSHSDLSRVLLYGNALDRSILNDDRASL